MPAIGWAGILMIDSKDDAMSLLADLGLSAFTTIAVRHPLDFSFWMAMVPVQESIAGQFYEDPPHRTLIG